MTPTKLLIGQILVVLAIITLSIWTATQWTAAQLAHQPELGTPWFVLLDQPIYLPWSIFPWWFSFEAYAPAIFDKAGAIAAAGGLIGCGAAIAGSLWRARQSSNVTTYGSARWATHKDITAKQQFQLQHMMAAQFRSEAIEQSRRATQAAEARAATKTFLGTGSAYTPD